MSHVKCDNVQIIERGNGASSFLSPATGLHFFITLYFFFPSVRLPSLLLFVGFCLSVTDWHQQHFIGHCTRKQFECKSLCSCFFFFNFILYHKLLSYLCWTESANLLLWFLGHVENFCLWELFLCLPLF